MRAPHGQKTPSSPRIQITSTIICLLKRQAYPCFDLEIGISRILKASLVSSSSVSTNPTPHLYGFSWPTSLPTNSPTPPRSYIYKQSLSLLYTQWSAPLSLSLSISLNTFLPLLGNLVRLELSLPTHTRKLSTKNPNHGSWSSELSYNSRSF